MRADRRDQYVLLEHSPFAQQVVDGEWQQTDAEYEIGERRCEVEGDAWPPRRRPSARRQEGCEREAAAAARRMQRAAEADKRRQEREAAALVRKQQREAEAAKKIEQARLKGDLKAIDRISEALALKNRKEAEELARANKSELAALERANQASRQKLRAAALEDEQKLRAAAAEARRRLREAQAIEEIHDKWVADDRIGAENIAEDLVKANRASLMGLERAEADAAGFGTDPARDEVEVKAA